MMTVKRGAFLLFIGLMVLLAASAASYGNPADAGQGPQQRLHATCSAALHEAVKGHAMEAAEARRLVAGLLDDQGVARQAKIAGFEPAALKARIAALSDVEILALRRQLMPRSEQAGPAGMEEKYLIPALAGAGAGLAIAMFMFAY